MTDDYQRRYLEHLERKAAMIAKEGRPLPVSEFERRSVRIFEDREIRKVVLDKILEAARQAPQSCNRQAIKLKIVPGKKIVGWLPGGEGWIGKAPIVVLVFADLAAYKSPNERVFMPWLDAGVILATLAYAAHEAGLGGCIINPHIWPKDELPFRDRYNEAGRLFCGAVALGYAGIVPDKPEKKPGDELVEWA